jgi:hypothetical protein
MRTDVLLGTTFILAIPLPARKAQDTELKNNPLRSANQERLIFLEGEHE